MQGQRVSQKQRAQRWPGPSRKLCSDSINQDGDNCRPTLVSKMSYRFRGLPIKFAVEGIDAARYGRGSLPRSDHALSDSPSTPPNRGVVRLDLNFSAVRAADCAPVQCDNDDLVLNDIEIAAPVAFNTDCSLDKQGGTPPLSDPLGVPEV
jgi:hypothetical protein